MIGHVACRPMSGFSLYTHMRAHTHKAIRKNATLRDMRHAACGEELQEGDAMTDFCGSGFEHEQPLNCPAGRTFWHRKSLKAKLRPPRRNKAIELVSEGAVAGRERGAFDTLQFRNRTAAWNLGSIANTVSPAREAAVSKVVKSIEQKPIPIRIQPHIIPKVS